jgi:hypothetical protein
MGVLAVAAQAADGETYVLMNIPYGEFYASELNGDAPAVDGVTSATLNKPRTGMLAGGSYHQNADGSDISGVIYPVLVRDPSMLEGLNRVEDSARVEITVVNRGKESTTVYEGAEALFEAPSHSYYVLSETPAYYKELSRTGDSFAFSAVKGEVASVDGVTAALTLGGRHTDVEIVLENTAGIESGAQVSGVVLTASDGSRYGLRHVYNIWRGTELGWNLDEALAAIDGKTITNIRYYTESAVIDYPVSLPIADLGSTGFSDIPKDADYAEAVIWARKNRITNGTGNGIFSPDLTVDRATLIAFLWKQAGQPRPEGETSPFADVAEDAWYRNAVLWAVETGVTDGTGGGSFSPRETVDMAQIVGFLWKAAGSPEAAEQSFPGVPAEAWYAPALAWAAEKGLVSGEGFAPAAPCTRAEIVSLLYRAAN